MHNPYLLPLSYFLTVPYAHHTSASGRLDNSLQIPCTYAQSLRSNHPL